MVLPDGTPVPDLSGLLLEHELVALWEQGKLNDLDSLDALFADFSDVKEEDLVDHDEVDVSTMMERFRAQVQLASSTPEADPNEGVETGDWIDISRNVVAWTRNTLQLLRDAKATGHMVVLAPSPGTGKSRGMMEAATYEQNARRRVGYAVLSRAQIPEAAERLRSSGSTVRLIVIEGRHNGNCMYMDQVNVATSAGFSPGSTVCPSCPMYPGFSGGRRNVCGYYKARIDASRDRFFAAMGMRVPAIILTTHASAVQGSHITTRRYQGFWAFDTLFLDEDPTGSIVQQYEITEEMLTFSARDANGNPTGPTWGTMVLREAMKKAMEERKAAEERGFVLHGSPDRVHTRGHGSTYAGSDLHALLEPIARAHRHTLKGLASAVVDGMSDRPEKGEIMNLDAAGVAARFPSRYLAPLFAALDVEITTIAEARAAGVDLEPAYRVHLDLVPTEDGHRAAFRVHDFRKYANGQTNLVIGDAYADIDHYEGLFGRYRRDGKVQIIKHRATWPTTSTLIRIVTRAGSKHLNNHTQLLEHLEKNVRPILEMERGRRIVFYCHLAMKGDFAAWVEGVREELEILEYAIEHWGSGRGKDTYKDFDTFVAVTEFVPNIGALMHEANTVAALASTSNTRVAHWSAYAPREGASRFAQSLMNASPFLQAAFRRKATDELAQAVHRIRPAIPSETGRQKRAYVMGHLVPWTDELIAATAATAVVDSGNDDVDLETEALDRGARFAVTETLSLITEREVAGAIVEVFRNLQCWSHSFAHCLISVPDWATIDDLVRYRQVCKQTRSRPILRITFSEGVAGSSGSSEDVPMSPLTERVLSPPNAWQSIAGRIRDYRVYRAALARVVSQLPFTSPRLIRPDWVARGSRGFEFWGDRDRCEQVFAAYAPTAEKVPF